MYGIWCREGEVRGFIKMFVEWVHQRVGGMCGIPSSGGVKLYVIWCRDGEVGKNHQGVRRMSATRASRSSWNVWNTLFGV